MKVHVAVRNLGGLPSGSRHCSWPAGLTPCDPHVICLNGDDTFYARRCSRPLQRTAEEELEDSIFSQAFIPKHLEQVDDHERDFERLVESAGAAEGIYYQVGQGLQE